MWTLLYCSTPHKKTLKMEMKQEKQFFNICLRNWMFTSLFGLNCLILDLLMKFSLALTTSKVQTQTPIQISTTWLDGFRWLLTHILTLQNRQKVVSFKTMYLSTKEYQAGIPTLWVWQFQIVNSINSRTIRLIPQIKLLLRLPMTHNLQMST